MMSSQRLPGRYRLYLVEEGDDNRERVISCDVIKATIDHKPVYEEVYSYDGYKPYRLLQTETYTLTAQLQQQPDGTAYRIEDFSESDEDE